MITGATTTRTRWSSSVTSAFVPNRCARYVASSIGSSAAGHSRAWWMPMTKETGFWSSMRFTSDEISTPIVSRPWKVFFGSVTGAHDAGYWSRSFLRSTA